MVLIISVSHSTAKKALAGASMRTKTVTLILIVQQASTAVQQSTGHSEAFALTRRVNTSNASTIMNVVTPCTVGTLHLLIALRTLPRVSLCTVKLMVQYLVGIK